MYGIGIFRTSWVINWFLEKENEIIYPVLKEVEKQQLSFTNGLSDVHSSVIAKRKTSILPYYKYLKDINIKDCLDGVF
ncbi:hypothetical protein AB432_027815 [Brevibacillus brevis]|uniref:Uncharacterized protein n=1 Tax=Brevibacillus brevis TaxID=1393 RepID=A0A2Z4MQ09_BREBE|nr:hypothetical protein AB432_027815 [Brevibacillus brevis]